MNDIAHDPERVLVLKMEGPGVADGRMSVLTLAAKLDAAQRTLYNIGLASKGGPVASRGTWSRTIRTACELMYVASKGGSLTVTTELADNEVLPGISNFGPHVLKTLKNVVGALIKNDEQRLVELLPDSTARVRALRSIEALCPRAGDDFSVGLGNGDGSIYGVLNPSTRETINSLFYTTNDDSLSDLMVLAGDLVEIRVKAGTPHISVLSRQREVICYYSGEMEDIVSQLVAGSIVEVKGRGQFSSDGTIKQIDEIHDVETVDLSPIRISTFLYDNRTFVLKEPVFCSVGYRNELWVYECEQYRLHAFDERREIAFRRLAEDFAILYDGLNDELDEALTLDAIELRDRIKGNIDKIEAR